MNLSSSPAVTVWTTAVTAVMSCAVHMTHAAATSLPAVTEPASLPPSPATGRVTVWMAQMRETACASRPSQPVLPSSTCASQAIVSTSIRCATDRRTARTTAMKKAVVRDTKIRHYVTILMWIDLSVEENKHLSYTTGIFGFASHHLNTDVLF